MKKADKDITHGLCLDVCRMSKPVNHPQQRQKEERMTNIRRGIYFFLIGFLTNSVMMRLAGKVDDWDIFYPVFITFILCATLIVDWGKGRRK